MGQSAPPPPPASALAGAFAVQHAASLKGFDWQDPLDALAKVREEAEEVAAHLAGGRATRLAGASDTTRGTPSPARERPDGGHDPLADELGDLLFAVVNVARLADVDPAAALARAIAKFEERFAEVERLARQRGLPMPGTPLEELDRLWDEIKTGDRRAGRGADPQ